MILLYLILLPILGGIVAGLIGRSSPNGARWISLLVMLTELGLALFIWLVTGGHTSPGIDGQWLLQYRLDWVPQLGIGLFLALDGLSLLMVVLTAFLGVVAVVASWKGITERIPFYYFNLLWILGGVLGVFLALDLFLFYFFWEMMLIPMYFLIGIWGHENRTYAAIKFFIFTQASGLLMLLSILGLYFVHHAQTGVYTFNYVTLLQTSLGGASARWLMLGFFVAFAVKLPAFPFHPWLADAHTEAPTAGSVILAGLLLKTGAYGLIRFVLPLFPDASRWFAPAAMTIGVIGILYGAILAFGQRDLKRLVAYTSVSHLGFVLLGVFAFNTLAMQGAIMQMICHGLSTGALFVIVGTLQDRIHTRDMTRMGGLWDKVPRMGAVAMFFAIASLGLPGLGNFVGEFLVLVGAFQSSVTLSVLASIGLVGAAIYSLWIMQQTFHGKARESWDFPDLGLRTMSIMAAMMVALVWLGLYPQPVIRTATATVDTVQQRIEATSNPEVAFDNQIIETAGKEASR